VPLLDAFAELRTAATRSVMSACPSLRLSVRMKQLGSRWTDFRGIYFDYLSKIRLQMKIGTGNVRISVTQARSHNPCCHGKALSVTYPECVSVASVFQHAVHMHPIILTSVACLPLYHIFAHSVIKGTICGQTLLNKKCVFWFFLRPLFATLPFIRRIQRHIINVRKVSCKYPLFLSDFNETCIFSTDFIKKNTQIQNFMNIHQLGVEFHTDGRTDRHDEANFDFPQHSEYAVSSSDLWTSFYEIRYWKVLVLKFVQKLELGLRRT